MWFHVRLLERCNLNCSSCYAKDHNKSKIMNFDLFKEVLKKIQEVKKYRPGFSVIYLSGGEPLLHPDFYEILAYCYNHFERISILTNGILLKKAVKNFIKYRKNLCIQISLDGDRVVNDKIRGPGVFNKAIEALFILKEYKIRHWISYTVSRANKECYRNILDICHKTGSYFNNVTPYTGNADFMLSYIEWKEFKYKFELYAKQLEMPRCHGENCCGFKYSCGANYNGLTINPDGMVAGCARIDNICGSFNRMENYLISNPWSIQQTCMKQKWGSLKNFKFLYRLE